MSKEFSNKIKNINFLLTCLVVLLHCNCMVYANTDLILYPFINYINDIISVICDIAVPSFFVLSSFLFFQNYNSKKCTKKITSRIKSLVVPYLFWNTIFLIYNLIIFQIPGVSGMNSNGSIIIPEISVIFILKSIIFAYYTPLWYIRTLFFLVLVSPIIYYIIKKFNKKSLLLIPIIFVINFIIKASYSGNTSFLYWMPLYYIVAYFTIWHKEKIINYDFKLFNINKIFIIISYISLVLITTKFMNNNIIVYIYKMISPLYMYIFLKNDFLGVTPKNIANNSFFIYCTHFSLNVVIKRIIIIFIGNNAMIMLLLRIITFIITICLLNIIATIWKKILPKFYGFVVGGRY